MIVAYKMFVYCFISTKVLYWQKLKLIIVHPENSKYAVDVSMSCCSSLNNRRGLVPKRRTFHSLACGKKVKFTILF